MEINTEFKKITKISIKTKLVLWKKSTELIFKQIDLKKKEDSN